VDRNGNSGVASIVVWRLFLIPARDYWTRNFPVGYAAMVRNSPRAARVEYSRRHLYDASQIQNQCGEGNLDSVVDLD